MIPLELKHRVKIFANRFYPAHNLEGHIIPVVNLGAELADELLADRTVVEIASYLHDVGRIRFGGYKHDISGAYYARFKLWQFGFPKKEADKIAHCILAHRGAKEYPPETLEAEILKNADALSHFECSQYLFAIKYSTCKNLSHTIGWLKRKLEHDLKDKLSLHIAHQRAEERYEKFIKPELDRTWRYSRL